MDNNKKSEKTPSGAYHLPFDTFPMLMEIAPRIYTTLLARQFEVNDKLFNESGAKVSIDAEWLASDAVYHAKVLIDEISKNRFYH